MKFFNSLIGVLLMIVLFVVIGGFISYARVFVWVENNPQQAVVFAVIVLIIAAVTKKKKG